MANDRERVTKEIFFDKACETFGRGGEKKVNVGWLSLPHEQTTIYCWRLFLVLRFGGKKSGIILEEVVLVYVFYVGYGETVTCFW